MDKKSIKYRSPDDSKEVMDLPNSTTRQALEAAEAKELGIIPDDSPTFTDLKSLQDYLDG